MTRKHVELMIRRIDAIEAGLRGYEIQLAVTRAELAKSIGLDVPQRGYATVDIKRATPRPVTAEEL